MKYFLKNWLTILIYLSVAYVIYYLIKNNLLVIPDINNYFLLFLSIIVLFAGFFLYGYSWQLFLKSYGYPVSVKDGFISIGLFNLAKYIPGKVWLVLGSANYITKRYDYPSKKLMLISLNYQLLSIWIALVLGSIGMLLIDGFKIWGVLVLGLWIALTLAIFFPEFHKIFQNVYNKVFKKNYEIPIISRKLLFKLLFPFSLPWIFWSLGFYLFMVAINFTYINFVTALSFPLASALGILAIISPGGLGVREGILTAYLTLAGFELTFATTIAFSSRLWYLIGEVLTFITSYILNLKNKKNINAE
jgi:uncharacterized membrane protein YbhN (UPF0104 family)